MISSPHTDLHHVLSFDRKHTYQTKGSAWRELIASLAFETKVDLSLSQYFWKSISHSSSQHRN